MLLWCLPAHKAKQLSSSHERVAAVTSDVVKKPAQPLERCASRVLALDSHSHGRDGVCRLCCFAAQCFVSRRVHAVQGSSCVEEPAPEPPECSELVLCVCIRNHGHPSAAAVWLHCCCCCCCCGIKQLCVCVCVSLYLE